MPKPSYRTILPRNSGIDLPPHDPEMGRFWDAVLTALDSLGKPRDGIDIVENGVDHSYSVLSDPDQILVVLCQEEVTYNMGNPSGVADLIVRRIEYTLENQNA